MAKSASPKHLKSASKHKENPNHQPRRSRQSSGGSESWKSMGKTHHKERNDSTVQLNSSQEASHGQREELTVISWIRRSFNSTKEHTQRPQCFPEWRRPRHKIKPLLTTFIFLLLVFSSLYFLLNYLLLFTRASAACTPSTVYVPVTYIVTSTTTALALSSAYDPNNGISASVPLSVTGPNTANMDPASIVTAVAGTAGTASAAQDGPTFYFYVTSGSTIWENGFSPSSGQLLTYATTSVFMIPAQPSGVTSGSESSIVSNTSTVDEFQAFTAPAFTSTFFSLLDPAMTMTLTSTHFVTYTISRVDSDPQTTYATVSSGSWNESSTTFASAEDSSATVLPTDTTLTRIVYQSTGEPVTSTTTTYITTTMDETVYTTVTPMSQNSAPSPSTGSVPALVSTVTAPPKIVTVTVEAATTSSSSNAVNGHSTTLAVSTLSSFDPGSIFSTSSEVRPDAPSSYKSPSFYSIPWLNSSSTSIYATGASMPISSIYLSSANASTFSNSVSSTAAVSAITGSLSTTSSTLHSANTSPLFANSTSSSGQISISTTLSGLPNTLTSSMIRITTTFSSIVLSTGVSKSDINSSTQSKNTSVSSQSTIVSTSISSLTPTVTAISSVPRYSAPSKRCSSTAQTVSAVAYTSSSLANPMASSSAYSATLLNRTSILSLSTGPQGVSTSTTSSESKPFSANPSSDSMPSTKTGAPTSTINATASLPIVSFDPSNGLSIISSSINSVTSTSSAQTTSFSMETSLPTGTSSIKTTNSSTGAGPSAGTSVPMDTSASTGPISTSASNSITGSLSSIVKTVSSASFSTHSVSSNGRASSSLTLTSSKEDLTTTSRSTPTPSTGCGEQGSFSVDFDDLPFFWPTNPNTTDITQAPPVPNPYHHLSFSNGYVYAPQPSEPFTPVSPPHLAVFLANGTGMKAGSLSPYALKSGEIGDGTRGSLSAFWFDAHSAFLGCDNAGPDECELLILGYTWDLTSNQEILSYSQNASLPPCPNFKDCKLEQVNFPTSFRGLSGLQIQAYVDNQPRMFFMDNLDLAWTNKTCAAGKLRQSSQ